MKLRKIMALILAICMVLSTMGNVAFAAPVAVAVIETAQEVTAYAQETAVLTEETTAVATVDGKNFTDLQEAIKEAAPNGTVDIVDDIVVDEWVMIAESLTISGDTLITLEIDGLTINGNGKTLTINSIESAGNGGYLFYDASNLTIENLTIKYADGLVGGIGLKAGTISGVTFDGGVYGVMPQTGDVTITGCTFKTNGTAIYFEEDRDGLVVDNNTFDVADGEYSIILRGDADFTNNTVLSGKVNLANSASGAISGNDFGDNRFKVYNAATANIENNEINVLVFNDDSEIKSTFGENTYSEDAEDVLKDAGVLPDDNTSEGGSGTEEDPILINTAEDLIALRDAVNSGDNYAGKYVMLNDDIDLSSVSNWTPIGDVLYNSNYAPADTTKVFSGTFDGNDKVISNLKIEKFLNDAEEGPDADANVGLFGIIGEGAVIRDLTITNVNINTDGRNVGALAGVAYKATLDNITVNGDIQITGGNNVCGVCAMTRYYDVSATNITVSGEEGSYINGNNIVAGMFAEIAPNGSNQTFENLSVENVAINGVGGVGGIVGLLTNGSVSNVSVKNVELVGNTAWPAGGEDRIRIGSIAGLLGSNNATISGVTVENVTAKNLDDEDVVLPVVGANYGASSNATEAKIGDTYYATLAKAVAAAEEGDTVTLLCDIENVIEIPDGVALDKNGYRFGDSLTGMGTEEDPYLINNIDDLVWFRNDVNAGNTYEGKYVKLTADIDLEGYEEMNVNHLGNNVSASTFRPIGDYSCNKASFKGIFDGGNNTISNLYISGWDINYHWDNYGPAGLFGTVENAIIKNLTVEGFEIQVEGGDVAAIAGHAKGNCTFENITVTDSKIATYNNGCAGIVAWSEAGNYTFNGIEVTDSVVLAGLWGSFDSSIGGVVAQLDNDGMYSFEDVKVACRLDVYNDVTASYDYYNYRMCGMLIGRSQKFLKENSREVDLSNVTCKNVKITIGEWANYHYCDPTPGYNNGRGMRVEPGYTYDGLPADYDHSTCTVHHMACIPMTSIVGGGQMGYTGTSAEELVEQGFDETEIKVVDFAKIARSNVAKIGDNYFDSLQKAINSADDGDVITLINNINLADTDLQILDGNYDTYFLVEGKNITIDLNGKTISGAYTGSMLVGVFSTDKNGHLTITGNGTVDVTATGKVYALVACYNDGSTITIENGTYKADKVSDSLIFYGGKTDDALTVKGGTFTLGNVGTGENGKPWIFNVVGSGDHHVLITGGTFNADINRQHWSNEAVVDENCYTVNNGNGTYTVKEGAVAYVKTGMTTGPYYAPKNIGYATLAEAIAAAVAANDSPVVLIKDITDVEEFAINANSPIVLDLNGKTLNGAIKPSTGDITVKNGSIVNENSGSSAIEINSGKLTLENVNIDSARHAVRIDGDVTAVVNGGTYKTIVVEEGKTQHAFNISGTADVTINNGTFTGPKGTAADSGSAIKVKTDSVVTINGGNFSGGKNSTLSVDGTMSITGGTFDQDPSAYVADDYFAYTETGAFVVEEEMVAKIGDVKFKTLQNAVDAAREGDVIVIRNDFELDTKVAVANGKKITLDLNGKTITGRDNNTTGNFYLFDNRGDLTIKGEGKITLTATTNREWNASSVVVANNPGGKLTIENGTIEHLGGTDMAYGIDNLTNGKGTYAETIVNGGTIKSTYRGIRQFLNGIEAQNILTVNGGTVEGANKSIWMQDPSTKANTGKLTVADGAALNGDVYLFVTAGSTEWPVEVSIAKSAVNGEVLSANVPAGYEVIEENGYYGIEVTTADVYTVEAIADKTEVRYNNGNPDSFTVKYVVTGGNVAGAMAQFKYDTDLFICEEDSNATGRIRMNSMTLTTDANGKTLLKELHFTVKKNVDVNTTYTFTPEYVQVVSDEDAAGSGAQNGYVENVKSVDVTVVAQYDVTLPTDNTLEGNTYVDQNAEYSAIIKDFDENKTYTITYTMGGVEQPAITVTKDNVDNGGFVIENVTGDIVFTDVNSKLNYELILLPEAVSGYTLVLVKDGVSAGYTYNGDDMFAVKHYVGLTSIVDNADREEFIAEDGVDILEATSVRAILIKGGVTLDEARNAITVSANTSSSLDNSNYDINGDDAFWFSDAATAHYCYKDRYTLYENMSKLNWYLNSDVNIDFVIDTDDYDDTVEAFWATLD